jgi:hypothetical protein
LDFLGFPWIRSSETRLINWLGGKIDSKNFPRGFPLAWAAPEGNRAVEAMRKRRIVHAGEPNLPSDFRQGIVREVVSLRLNPRATDGGALASLLSSASACLDSGRFVLDTARILETLDLKEL